MGDHNGGAGRKGKGVMVVAGRTATMGENDPYTPPKGADQATKDAFKLGKKVLLDSDVTSRRSYDDAVSQAQIVGARIRGALPYGTQVKAEVVTVKYNNSDGTIRESMYAGLRATKEDLPNVMRALREQRVNTLKVDNSYFTGALVS